MHNDTASTSDRKFCSPSHSDEFIMEHALKCTEFLVCILLFVGFTQGENNGK